MKKFVLVACLILYFSSSVFANVATLTISGNTTEFITSFHIFKSTTAGQYDYTMPFATVSADVNGMGTFQDTVPNDKNYYYVVRSVGATGLESVDSNEVIASPLPPSPPSTNIKVVPGTMVLQVNGVEAVRAAVGTPVAVTQAIKPGSKSVSVSVSYQ